MKRNSIAIIIIITALALFGIIVTQLFWIRNALQLQKEQFDHRVSIALKSVVNTMADEAQDTLVVSGSSCKPGCKMVGVDVKSVIRPKHIDSLLREEFAFLNITDEFELGVFRRVDSTFIVGNNSQYKKELLQGNYCTSLSCLWKPDSYLLSVYFPEGESRFYRQIFGWLILSAVFLVIVIASFSYIALSLIRQKKLAEMKTDFVNNMTHEFKTPIATISLASEMLLKPSVYESLQKTQRYAGIIYEENNRLKNQVEQVLQVAILEKGEVRLNKSPVETNVIIDGICENFEIIVRQRDGQLIKQCDAVNSVIQADPVHFANVVSNLLENANKYTKSKPIIKISTRNVKNGVLISVEDNGIGISVENQKHVFKQFFRVHTGNLHDIKGFGLGLYYVKTIVEAHGGYVKLDSEVKKGTRFDVFFPF